MPLLAEGRNDFLPVHVYQSVGEKQKWPKTSVTIRGADALSSIWYYLINPVLTTEILQKYTLNEEQEFNY